MLKWGVQEGACRVLRQQPCGVLSPDRCAECTYVAPYLDGELAAFRGLFKSPASASFYVVPVVFLLLFIFFRLHSCNFFMICMIVLGWVATIFCSEAPITIRIIHVTVCDLYPTKVSVVCFASFAALPHRPPIVSIGLHFCTLERFVVVFCFACLRCFAFDFSCCFVLHFTFWLRLFCYFSQIGFVAER